ncbi:hypothetical protein OROGR_016417 [Orobanche gracilis]
MRRPLGSSAQANGDAYTPHVIAKQVALMSKVSAHFLRSFNREKVIFELTTQRGRNVQVGACAKLSLTGWQYIDRCYSIVEYCATWASEFSPLPHEAYWPESSSTKLLPNLELLRNKMDVLAQRDYEMKWTPKKEERRTFVEFAGKVVTTE